MLKSITTRRVSVEFIFFFFQAEDGIRDLVRSRGLGDVYKRQRQYGMSYSEFIGKVNAKNINLNRKVLADLAMNHPCLLYTSDAADERSSVDLGGRRIIKKKKHEKKKTYRYII